MSVQKLFYLQIHIWRTNFIHLKSSLQVKPGLSPITSAATLKTLFTWYSDEWYYIEKTKRRLKTVSRNTTNQLTTHLISPNPPQSHNDISVLTNDHSTNDNALILLELELLLLHRQVTKIDISVTDFYYNTRNIWNLRQCDKLSYFFAYQLSMVFLQLRYNLFYSPILVPPGT